MVSAEFITYKNKRIFFLDLSNLKDIQEGINVVEQATKTISLQPLKSVLLLTDVTDTRYDPEGADAIKKFSTAITPFLKLSCATGISGMKRIILNTLMVSSHHKIYVFDTRQQALDRLASEK